MNLQWHVLCDVHFKFSLLELELAGFDALRHVQVSCCTFARWKVNT